MKKSISLRILLSHTTSFASIVAPLYSVFVLKIAIVGCILQLHDIASLLREKINPEVNRLSALYPTQLASVPFELSWHGRLIENSEVHLSSHVS